MQTIPLELTACARAATHLAAQLAELHLAGPVDLLAAALPGTSTARAATTLGDAWVTRLTSLSRDVDAHAQRLTDAAAGYRGTDETTGTELAGLVRWEL